MEVVTGRPFDLVHCFYRRLLSEYNPHITLAQYIHYFELNERVLKIADAQAKEVEIQEACHLGVTMQNASFHMHPPLGIMNSTSMIGSQASMVLPPSMGSHTESSFVGQCFSESSSPSEVFSRRQSGMCPIHGSPAIAGKVVHPSVVQVNAASERVKGLLTLFWSEFRQSYIITKRFYINSMTTLVAQLNEVLRMPETKLRAALDEHGILHMLYQRFKTMYLYRELNLVGFRKLMALFLNQCATKSIALQQKVAMADQIISNGELNKPEFDSDGHIDNIISLYSIIHKLSYEQSQKRLELYMLRDTSCIDRIPRPTSAYYYTHTRSQRRMSGSYDLRLLSGMTSTQLTKRMSQLLICDAVRCKNYNHGTKAIAIQLSDDTVRGDDAFVVQSMADMGEKGSMSGSIMELILTIHALRLASAGRIIAVIPFMAYCKNPNMIAAIAEMLTVNGCDRVITVDLMSDQVEGMFGNVPVHNISATMEFVHYITLRLCREESDVTNLCVVCPDGDSVGKVRVVADKLTWYLNKQLFGAEREPTGTQAPSPVYIEEMIEGGYGIGAGAAAKFGAGLGGGVDLWDADPCSDNVKGSARRARLNNGAMPSVIAPAALAGEGGGGHLPPINAGSLSAVSATLPVAAEKCNSAPKVFIPIVTAMKQPYHEKTEINIVGDVKGKSCIIFDALIDEAANAYEIAKALRVAGAEGVSLIAVHALLSGNALDLISEPGVFDEVIVSDSINNYEAMKRPEVAKVLRIITIAPLLARAIKMVHADNSISTFIEDME